MDRGTLTQRRQALGLTQQQLADEVGISHVTIWRWEAGETKPHPFMARSVEATLSRLERAAVVNSECAG